MGRDEHTKGGNNAASLPQTPKNQKLSASEMRAEMARELDNIESLVNQRKPSKKRT
ncbi:hypothetical protein [Sporosarcina sp. BI001-red]|uniref:hypothetical protein n=1 Tax=Sporosarcina sp. BI001-red TaxID=2282866 RepID=UPI0018F44BBF|nr:hypothetical protein [Sporosarcina sp. BI001-red]